MSYNTIQKDKILEIIKKKKKKFTIKELYNDLDFQVGLTTIYRLVNKLYKKGVLNKFIGDNNISYYEYLESCDKKNHFYLKCINCSKLIHIDCDCINELENHILNNHKFNVLKENIIINGICFKCGGFKNGSNN